MCVHVCVMSITGQAEDGCDPQRDAGVWVSAALRVLMEHLVQHGHLEEPGWSPRSSVQRSCWGPVKAGCCWSILQHGAALSNPGHRSWGAE